MSETSSVSSDAPLRLRLRSAVPDAAMTVFSAWFRVRLYPAHPPGCSTLRRPVLPGRLRCRRRRCSLCMNCRSAVPPAPSCYYRACGRIAWPKRRSRDLLASFLAKQPRVRCWAGGCASVCPGLRSGLPFPLRFTLGRDRNTGSRVDSSGASR